MRSLVIGAAGFSGRHLVRRIKREPGSEVIGADVRAHAPDGSGCDEYVAVDVTDASQVADLLAHAQPDRVYDLVGINVGRAVDIYRVNVIGRVNVLEAVRAHCPDAQVLVVGSAAEYGVVPEAACPVTETYDCRPVGPYGLSKFAATQVALGYHRQFGMRLAIVRPFNIIGAGMPESLVLGAIVRRAKAALAEPGPASIKIGNLDAQRDFVDVDDAVDAYVNLLPAGPWGEVFNICSGRPVPIRRLVDLALSHAPRPVSLEVDPALLRPVDAPVVYGSWEKARAAFGFRPITKLEESIRAAWEDQGS